MHATVIDINVNVSMKKSTSSAPKNKVRSPSISMNYYSNKQQQIYDDLYNKPINNSYPNYLKNKKIYTLQQIFDNVESIQKQYEEFIETPIISSSSCFFSFKQMIKNFNFLRNKTNEQIQKSNQIENKSPFIFGGETLQWIALPQYIDHIYENELIH
ncbi:unnamed protein product [Rotaria sp. Silwood2]|nr:unnamed protein product [Rotaria sp. Silwood2]CAF3539512.1 unnamed protein product [Rotaria sp. Silwood2]CAF4622285.1 unnamed protein product [Rotaria sp. Silwood2]CAF4785881.1 unnamed protein product [Rotaria sp. Silwood2]